MKIMIMYHNRPNGSGYLLYETSRIDMTEKGIKILNMEYPAVSSYLLWSEILHVWIDDRDDINEEIVEINQILMLKQFIKELNKIIQVLKSIEKRETK